MICLFNLLVLYLLWLNDARLRHRSWTKLAQASFFAWRDDAIPCANVNTALLRYCGIHLRVQQDSGLWFNIKMSSYQDRKFHCGDKTVVISSYLHNAISYTGKMTSLYWIRVQVTVLHKTFDKYILEVLLYLTGEWSGHRSLFSDIQLWQFIIRYTTKV